MGTAVHDFHIPVMGLGFTVDTPVKVAKFGMSSVVSCGDDILLEKLRNFYCEKYDKPYAEIKMFDEDYKARRVTEYLNLIKDIVDEQFLTMKNEDLGSSEDLKKYFELLPENSNLKKIYHQYLLLTDDFHKIISENEIKEQLVCGNIDINIMTKADKANVNKQKEPLPNEYNDAHAILRGFAMSNLKSGLVLSAGMNPRLYSYLASFPDFFPDKNGELNKQIILKVSDYRSAEIQGRFLAKKGLFVSEYRVESGLNCGGHAFASKGFLLGPVLEEFKEKRNELAANTYDMCQKVWEGMDVSSNLNDNAIKITAQGGIGTHGEQEDLLSHYNLDGTGWGTPFLLVPEAVNVDSQTLDLLKKAEEKDLYTSHVSPLGVLFNSLRNNSKELELQQRISKNRPGSACPKKFLSFNTEFTDKPICTASRQYQNLKIKDILSKDMPTGDASKQIDKVTAKTCLCVGLGTSALLVNKLDTKVEGDAVAVCPGPNMAYFDHIMSLKEMVDHIYGRVNALSSKARPHMFLKELGMYVKHFQDEIDDLPSINFEKQANYLKGFKENLLEGVSYYLEYFKGDKIVSAPNKDSIFVSLRESAATINSLFLSITKLSKAG